MEMLRFDFDVSATSNSGSDLNFSIDGIVKSPEDQADVVVDGGGQSILEYLQLGFSIFMDPELKNVILEGRAGVIRNVSENVGTAAIRMLLNWVDDNLSRLYILTNFSYKRQDVDYQIELAKKCFVLEKRGTDIVCLPRQLTEQIGYSDFVLGNQSFADWVYVDDPYFIEEFANSINSICIRYGLKAGLNFSYHYALGRSPDPRGLNEKMREVVTGRKSLRQICETFIDSEEFRRRNIDLLLHPNNVIASWASLAEASVE